MAKLGRPGLPEKERRRVWELWKQGQSFSAISRAVGVPPGSVYSILRPRGGIYYPHPRPPRTALTLHEREEISRGLAAGISLRLIAERLGRPASTVSREITRNKGAKAYRAVDAHDRADRRRARRQRLKLENNPVLRNYVRARLERRWSPDQIAERLRRTYSASSGMRISHEGVYRGVYLGTGRGLFPRRITQNLRRKHPIRRGKSHTTRGQWRSQIKNARPLSQRPQGAHLRCELGHWEGDLILGTRTTQVATLVDRTTREVKLVRLDSRRMQCVEDELVAAFRVGMAAPVSTVTWDRGMELAGHEAITARAGVEIFFADPRSPWQRGTNENTNGLVRQYLPKKTDLGQYSQQALDAIADELNDRPRRCLDYQTPLEARQALLP